MKRGCCVLFFALMGVLCFAQISFDDGRASSGLSSIADKLDYSPSFNVFRPVPLADETGQITGDAEDKTLFDNSPQWVKDLRRGEIVFFGSLPFTVFFARFFVDLARMGMHGWDRRYAPWPFQSAGGISMSNADLVTMFSIAAAASLSISIADHLIVRHKRKTAAEAYDNAVTDR